MRGIWSARECYCAVRVTVRRRWCDIVMLSSCALSEGVPGVRFFTLSERYNYSMRPVPHIGLPA